jgi:hypothetical protein
MPLEQFINFYEGLAGTKVKMATSPEPTLSLRVMTARPLTKSEALQCLEDVLKEQASLVIIHGADASLTAVSKPNESQY